MANDKKSPETAALEGEESLPIFNNPLKNTLTAGTFVLASMATGAVSSPVAATLRPSAERFATVDHYNTLEAAENRRPPETVAIDRVQAESDQAPEGLRVEEILRRVDEETKRARDEIQEEQKRNWAQAAAQAKITVEDDRGLDTKLLWAKIIAAASAIGLVISLKKFFDAASKLKVEFPPSHPHFSELNIEKGFRKPVVTMRFKLAEGHSAASFKENLEANLKSHNYTDFSVEETGNREVAVKLTGLKDTKKSEALQRVASPKKVAAALQQMNLVSSKEADVLSDAAGYYEINEIQAAVDDAQAARLRT
jgi:hypothetical protein